VGTGSRQENALKDEANEVSSIWPDDDVILFDGVCVFCSRWVRFVIARDAAARFRFTPIQSAYGTRLAQALGINPDDPDTNAVVHGGVAHFKSEGALTVLSCLPGWSWVRVLFAVPRPLRDAVYNVVAKNRYRIFGKYDACIVPDAELRARVLE
jgi:predicted DCC family thiol-disulfide oxidoreductase YuxK